MGYAFATTPINNNGGHQLLECSGKGVCDRKKGECSCFDGYEGQACRRTTCPNSCSGHGTCQAEWEFASKIARKMDDLEELTDVTNTAAGLTYERKFESSAPYGLTGPWDAEKTMGCLCDDGFRGPDCSLIECPSGEDINGGQDNLNGRDCSGRGDCDYSTGVCSCYEGYYGAECERQIAMI